MNVFDVVTLAVTVEEIPRSPLLGVVDSPTDSFTEVEMVFVNSVERVAVAPFATEIKK